MAQIKLRAARESDRTRLEELWRAGVPDGAPGTYFFDGCFVPDHVEASLVLLEDDVIQSMVFFLPTFWYDSRQDRYAPAPCLVGLTTAAERRHRKYGSWLVETACDFLVEKKAGGVWTVLPDDTLELFFSMQGFWTLPGGGAREVLRTALPAAPAARRAEPQAYETLRESLLRHRSHIVMGPGLAALQRDMAERRGGGLFTLELPDEQKGCAIAVRSGGAVELRELLCPPEYTEAALAQIAGALEAERYCWWETGCGCGMLRLMNDCAAMERPEGYLGCGPLLD